jgi:hypothetical protein
MILKGFLRVQFFLSEKVSSKTAISSTSKVQALIDQVQKLGYVIRKEKLKQGFGWRCQSGSCHFKGQPVLFLDSKLSLEEQADFLSSFLASRKIAA